MRAFVHLCGSAVAVLALGMVAHAQAQKPAAPASPEPAKAGVAVRPTNPTQVLATVNNEKITKAEFLDLVNRYNLPTDDLPTVYHDGIDTLINVKLLNQFLARQGLKVSEEKIDADIENIKRELKANGQDLATALINSGNEMDDVRKQLAFRQQWIAYVDQKATDNELRRFVNSNRDLFDGTQIKPSHILLKVPENASAQDKAKVRARLAQIKKDIESNKYTFAEAANKFSEDENKTEGDGGDIGYITRNQGILEEFANPAFKLKVGQISDPVETLHGYHLILVTDRKPGQPFKLEQQQQLARTLYAAELQKQILIDARKTAKIDVKKMPADLFETTGGPAPEAKKAETTKTAAPRR